MSHGYSWRSYRKSSLADHRTPLIWCYVVNWFFYSCLRIFLLSPYHYESHLNLHFYNLNWAQTRRVGSMQYISYCNVRPSIRYSSISVGRETVQAWLQMVYDGTGSISAAILFTPGKSSLGIKIVMRWPKIWAVGCVNSPLRLEATCGQEHNNLRHTLCAQLSTHNLIYDETSRVR